MSISALVFKNNYIKFGTISQLPAFGALGYPTGHLFIDRVTGAVYRNLGTKNQGSLHVCEGVNYHTLRENFRLRPGINADHAVPAANTYNTAQMQLGLDKTPHFEVLGTNATSATAAFADGGGLKLTTTTADNDQVIIAPHLDSAVSSWTTTKWNTGDNLLFEATIKTGAAITATLWAGFKLTNTSVTATDADQVFFRYAAATNSGKWQCISSNTGTDDEDDSGVTVAVSTTYHLQVVLVGTRQPVMRINGVEVARPAALKADTDLIPYVGIQTNTAAAKDLYLYSLACGKTLGNN